MEITSVSIRRLNLQGDPYYYYEWLVGEDQYIQLSRSPLGKQCETLLINVRNRRNVLDLVNNIPNLQALNVRCGDVFRWSDENDELVEWLHQLLPSTCTIMRHAYSAGNIQLWIR